MYPQLKTLGSPLNTGYPSPNDILAQAQWAELSRERRQPGRTRGSLRINLDVRRARQGYLSG